RHTCKDRSSSNLVCQNVCGMIEASDLANIVTLHVKLQLQVLDLSNNMIGDIDTQELPPALVIMNLADNPCCGDPDFRQRITSSLLGLV
ncbi:unnamed protein product, partial [Scytosiphon promiscuus]